MVSEPSRPRKPRSVRRKNAKTKVPAMPGLIFAEGKINTDPSKNSISKTATPPARETSDITPTRLTGEEYQNSPSEITVETDTMNAVSHITAYAEREQTARRWMWLGVVSFAAMVGVLWGWSFYVKISSLKWNQSPDYLLIDNTKKNLDAFFEKDPAKQSQSEKTKAQLKEALSAIMLEFNNASGTNSGVNTTASNTTTSKH